MRRQITLCRESFHQLS
ncbi:hypothetical protein D047_2753A, partial [Vibrio parahaemolyticus VPTS-2010_2]